MDVVQQSAETASDTPDVTPRDAPKKKRDPEKNRAWYVANRERILEKHRARRQELREDPEYREKNRVRALQRRQRLKEDPEYLERNRQRALDWYARVKDDPEYKEARSEAAKALRAARNGIKKLLQSP